MSSITRMDIVDIELNSGNVHRSWLNHSIGSGDNNANAFGVRLFRNSEPVDIGAGWVQGFFRNSQGQNIALTENGVIDGNVTYVTLPQACYNYEGQFTLAIKLISPGFTSTVTMRIVDGIVDNTNTGGAVAPTGTVPTYQEILAVYDDLVASLEEVEDYADNFAPEFAAGTANAAGSYVMYEGDMYLLPNGHTANTTWANTTKTQVNVGGQLTDLKSALGKQKADFDAQAIKAMAQYSAVTPSSAAGILKTDNTVMAGTGYRAYITVTPEDVYKVSGRQFNIYDCPAYLIRSNGAIIYVGWIEAGYFSDYVVSIPEGADELVVNLNSSAGVSVAIKKASKISTNDIVNTIQKANTNETNIGILKTRVDTIEPTVKKNTYSVDYYLLPSVAEYNSVTATGSADILLVDNTTSNVGYKASVTVEEGEVYKVSGRQFNATNAPSYIFRKNGQIVYSGWTETGYFTDVVVAIPAGVDELVVNLNSSAGVTGAIKKGTKFTAEQVQRTINATEETTNIADISKIQIGVAWNGSLNSKKATLYVPIIAGQDYFIKLPASAKITTADLIQKRLDPGSVIHQNVVYQNRSEVITAVANAHLLCVQFNSDSNIASSDFENYDFIVKPGDSEDYVSAIDYYARFRQNDYFRTMYDLIQSERVGENRVGGWIIRNRKNNPEILKHQQEAWGTSYYYDVNDSVDQYETINEQLIVTEKNIINSLPQEEIDFTPSDDGFTRIIMGKNRDDVFFVSYVASEREGAFGLAQHDAVEITSDFVNFTTVIKGDGETGDGIEVTGKTFLKVQVVKQFADGSYLIPLRCHDISSDRDGTYFYRLTADMQTLTPLQYTNLSGNVVPMVDEFNGQLYDWHVDIYGSKCICTTYGSRNPETDYGRVWYTEDNGVTWKQVFQMTNHYQDGVDPGTTITSTHMHGVCLDPYSGRMFVIAGEDNRNIFWSDKGMNTDDDDWNVIAIRNQTFYQIRGYSQVVGGYAFKDALIFGSDNAGLGTIDRLNKLDGGEYSELEPAHEFLPNAFKGTCYCQAEQYRRDMQTPLLFCMTHENAGLTESENEALNNKHRGRVVASYDGLNWTEIWRDDTYGSHTVNIAGTNVSRKFSYCTRGMNCYLLKNGDAIIKYSGRDFYYFGGDPLYSVVGYCNGSCKVRKVYGLEKWLK